jgi:hypothetical protein
LSYTGMLLGTMTQTVGMPDVVRDDAADAGLD